MVTTARGACRLRGVTKQTYLSVSQERLGRLGSILVCEFGVMNKALNTSHGWGISAHAHVQTALLYLRNGSADWVQFWCVRWGS